MSDQDLVVSMPTKKGRRTPFIRGIIWLFEREDGGEDVIGISLLPKDTAPEDYEHIKIMREQALKCVEITGRKARCVHFRLNNVSEVLQRPEGRA